MDNNKSHKIDLSPQGKKSTKQSRKEPRKPEARKIFTAYRPGLNIAKRAEEIQAKAKFQVVNGRGARKKYRKDKMDEESVKPKPEDDIKTEVKDQNIVPMEEEEKEKEKQEWKEGEGPWGEDERSSSGSMPTEVKMDERDIEFLKTNKTADMFAPVFANQTGLKDLIDWRYGLQDLTTLAISLNEFRQKEETENWNSYGLNKDFWNLMRSKGKDVDPKNMDTWPQTRSSRAQLHKVFEDMIYVSKQMNDESKYPEDKKLDKLEWFIQSIGGFYFGVMVALYRDIEVMQEQINHLTAIVDDYTREATNRKWKADQRVYSIEKVVDDWIRKEGPAKAEEKQIKRNEKIQQKKEENKKAYKEKGIWIADEEWKKLSRGQKVLKRWNFSDTHQVMDWRSWQSLSRIERDEFIKRKNEWWKKREEEISKEVGGDLNKKFEAMQKMRFFSRRYLWGNKTYDINGYRVRNFRLNNKSKQGQLKELDNTK